MNIRQVGRHRWSIVTRSGNDEPNFIEHSVEYIELDVVRMWRTDLLLMVKYGVERELWIRQTGRARVLG